MTLPNIWIQTMHGSRNAPALKRRYANRTQETTTTMGVEAAKIAIERVGITPQDIEIINLTEAYLTQEEQQ